MAKKAKTAAEKYVEKLLALVPEDKRAALKEALANEEALEFLGEGVLAQEDYSKLADEAAQIKKEAEALLVANKQWYADSHAELAKAAKLETELKKAQEQLKKAAGTGDDDDLDDAASGIQKRLEGFVSKEEAKQLVSEALKNVTLTQQQWGLDLATTLTNLAVTHLHEYKEPLDTRDLIAFAQKNNKNIAEAYGLMTADKAKERAELRAKEERDKLRKEIEVELRKEMQPSGHGLFPPPTGADPSTLVGLKADGKGGAADSLAEKAASMYQELVSKRGAA